MINQRFEANLAELENYLSTALPELHRLIDAADRAEADGIRLIGWQSAR